MLEAEFGWDQGRGSASVPCGVLLTCCQEKRGFVLNGSWGQAMLGKGTGHAVERPEPCAVPVQIILLSLVYGDRSAPQAL